MAQQKNRCAATRDERARRQLARSSLRADRPCRTQTRLDAVKRFLKLLGPGFITGASDDDPSGIGTYAVVGASLGFSMLWTAPLTVPLMIAVQYICGKIGMISGMGLAGVLRRYYSRVVLYPAVLALLIANTINVGADIGAVAAAINLLVPLPIASLILPVTLIILLVQVWGSYRLIERTFKWLTLALLAYIGSAFFAKPDWSAVLHGTLVPTVTFDTKFLTALVAVLGTTISPYLWFWQADQEVEEEISMGRTRLSQRRGATATELRDAALDTGIGMFFSNLVMYFVLLATATTLFTAGRTGIKSATDAAQALQPLAGNAASVLLALGLIGAGFLAVPVLTGSAAYAVADAFGWKRGLNEKPHRARAFYILIATSTLIGMLLNYLGINPIDALFWTAVINGFLAPPVLVLIMFVANDPRVLGKEVNGRGLNVLGWLITAIMSVASVALVFTWGR